MTPKPKPLVRVTAGPTRDTASQIEVPVNTDTPVHIKCDLCTASISIKIKNYRGLPHGSPSTHPYFSTSTHKKDQYSISFTLTPHRSIPGTDLVFGNDIDHPVRDKLPLGTGAAFKIVKTMIDPGIEGDLYADQPYLFGNALSSVNVLYVGDQKTTGTAEHATSEDTVVSESAVLDEGGTPSQGLSWRQSRDVPSDSSKRKAWFLGNKSGRQERWKWEEGREYKGDFFNPYIDFNDFSLKLPGFSISVLGYLGGEDYLRYVMKDKANGEVAFVVVFSLVKEEDLKSIEEGKEKEKEMEVQGQEGGEAFEPKPDDLD